MTATAEQLLIRWGNGQRQGNRCRSDDRRQDDYDDYANRGAGKDDAPLDWTMVGGRESGGWVTRCAR